MPLVELQNFLNDLVPDLPHMGRARSAKAPPHNPRSSRTSKKRFLRVQRSRAINDFIEAKDLSLVEVEVVVVEAILKAVADLFQALAELISTPSLEL
jgi:hypothetical protein